MKPENLTRLRDVFASSLRGAPRGLRVENKAAVGEIFIYDVIGRDAWSGEGVAATDVAEKLKELAGCKSLNIYINSPGGSVWDGKAIHAQLCRFNVPKTVYVDGIAASAASFIAMAGDKIVTASGATWMIHEAMGGAFGNAGDLEATAEVLRMETRNIAGIYDQRTKCGVDAALAWMADETWMDAATAKARGFCDEITTDEPVAQAKPAATAPVFAALAETQARIAPRIVDLARANFLNRNAASRGASPGQPGRSANASK